MLRYLTQNATCLAPDLVQVDAQALQYARGNPLAFSHESYEKVLSAYVRMIQAASLIYGQLDDLLRPWSEPDLTGSAPLATPNDEFYRRSDFC